MANQTDAEKKANAAAKEAEDKKAAAKAKADAAAAKGAEAKAEVPSKKYTTAALKGGHGFKSLMVKDGKGGYVQIDRKPVVVSDAVQRELAAMIQKGEFGLKEGSISFDVTDKAPVDAPSKTEVG